MSLWYAGPVNASLGRDLCRLVQGQSPRECSWDRLGPAAVREGLAPLLRHRAVATPPDVAATWADAANKTVFQGLRLLQLTRKATRALDAAGAGPVVVLKGPVVARLAWPDESLRPSLDIDLLVRPAARDAADRVLTELGLDYVPEQGGHAHQRLYSATALKTAIDLHTGFAQRYRLNIDYDPILARTQPADWLGDGARVLSEVDQLLHLCIHLANNRFESALKHLVDIHLWVTERPVDWDQVMHRALEWRITTLVSCVMRRAARDLNTAMPAGILAMPGASRLATRWLDGWLGDAPRRTPILGRAGLDRALVALPMLDSHQDRARFVAGWLRERLWAR
jgi:hypothetical protein